jgi:hypothetical protein
LLERQPFRIDALIFVAFYGMGMAVNSRRWLLLLGALLSITVHSPVRAQNLSALPSSVSNEQDQQPGTVAAPASESEAADNSQTAGKGTPASNTTQQSGDSTDKQSKRILWIIPNYRAVSAGTYLPPQSVKEKFWLATQDSFDYSSFVLAAMLAGYSQATNSSPEFHQGLAGYGRYYWHSFADEAVGNYFTEAIVPVVTHEDPRYYTLGKAQGTFLRRTAYAVSRLAVTRNDSGGKSFNFSEIAGNALGAGVSDLYYPRQERTLGKTADKWATQIGIDGIANLLKEFWPDIRRSVFRQKH